MYKLTIFYRGYFEKDLDVVSKHVGICRNGLAYVVQEEVNIRRELNASPVERQTTREKLWSEYTAHYKATIRMIAL